MYKVQLTHSLRSESSRQGGARAPSKHEPRLLVLVSRSLLLLCQLDDDLLEEQLA